MRTAIISVKPSFLFILCPTHLRNRTNSSSKRHSLFIGSKIPKDEEWPFAEGQARTEWHWLTASVTQPSLTCCLPMPPLSLSCLSGCCAVSLPPKSTYIRFTSSGFNLCLPFIAVTKISCQKASCLWQPTVATARSHLAWRQERKHFRHECQESFPEASIVSLFHSLFISDRSSFLFITLSLPTAKLHQQFVQKTLFIYRE